jgi:Zn-dependent peptidase ImmA (M78 family)/transcriptional regulator with XRE-family HTH domain
MDVVTLAGRAGVGEDSIDAFEDGRGGLGLAALVRIAKALGVPPTSFAHTTAPIVRASVDPAIVLRGAVGAWLGDHDREVLVTALRRARAFVEVGELLGAERLAEGFRPSAPPPERPYAHGYDVALRVRDLVPERPGAIRGLARLLEDRFNILVLRHRFTDSSDRVLGAACRSGEARLVAVNVASVVETTRRFTLAHELGHHLLDLDVGGATADEGERDAARFWLESHPREKRANAFAAMVLAPAPAVSGAIGLPRLIGSYDEGKRMTERARTAFGIGFAATAWHLHNLGYFDEAMVRTLLVAEPDADPLVGFEDESGYDGLHRRVFQALARGIISRARGRELLGEDLDAFDSAS